MSTSGQPYIVDEATTGMQLETLLNRAEAQGYLLHSIVPSQDATWGGGSKTGRFVVVLEHKSIARLRSGSPDASTP